ncbi:SHOCT domain-containing protein [Halobaculum limi]|uniref:SHOCT domain-containing protein n=1 Tax=Halobaculum limi TaxID=3031916 RepID=UPI0024069A4D|nr:SHOCT domain-containing protein [Halobaculum sp. YSMS11]
MSDSSPRLVTGAMLGLFLAFGVDTVVIVAALWYVGRVSANVAGGVSVAVLAVFGAWVVGRWLRLRGVGSGDDADDGDTEDDPVERLKRRYADGEIGDEEFEARLDRLLDADERSAERDGDGEHTRLRESN